MAKAVKKRGPGRPKKGEEVIPNNGRPTVMTPETIKQLETAFMLGCTDLQACLAANIGMSTLYEYQIKNPASTERKKLLKENPIYLARQSVVRGLQTNERLAFDYLKAKESGEFADRKIVEAEVNLKLTDFPVEPKTIAEWEKQVQEADAKRNMEATGGATS